MLTFFSKTGQSDCSGRSRRDFLRIGSLGLGGLSLPWLFRNQAVARQTGDFVRDKSVVFLFLCGGPSQIETFDPNMSAPAPCRSVTGEVATSIPGITFGGTFPQLAQRADRLAVVRSYSPHQEADHAKAIRKVFIADDPLGYQASIGALATRLRGRSLTSAGLPMFGGLIENEIDPQYREDMQRMRSSNGSGKLGASVAPFDPISKGGSGEITAKLPLQRIGERRALLRELDRINRQIDASGEIGALDQFQEQAIEVVAGRALRDAMDLRNEDPRLVQRYDTRSHRVGYLKKRPSTLGHRLLLARRLCEAGCGFVTVGSAGWDNHGNGKHPGVFEGMHLLGTPLDRAVSAFLDDVQQRGLSDKILLVITGEFGRTAKMEKAGGRDHWPGLCSLAFAGGGLPMGQVIGKSLKTADYPATDPVRLPNMVATIMHTLFDVGQLRLNKTAPQDLAGLVEKGQPIKELVL
ncbi:MAG: DUF1501 domain-containing protein [Planctomycetota bacterium]|nr:DUF1501 domain-containing protein [Planctomycetota bacterium]